MRSDKVDKRILRTVKQREQYIYSSISWISISIAFLYVTGYMWRHTYYNALGISPSIIEFSFPEILVPKLRLTIFLAQVFLTFLYFKYHHFYEEKRRSRRAKRMGIEQPLDDIMKYSLKQNVSSSGRDKKTNHIVFCEFVGKYVKEKCQDNEDWKFDRGEFESEVLKLFPDVPDSMKEDFVSYELQILFMDDEELKETVADAVGALPQGSEVYGKVSLYGFYTLLILYGGMVVLFGTDILWTLAFAAAGIGVGYFLYKISEYEDRFQLWHTLWVSILCAILLNGVDGHITAKSNLRKSLFPIATITQKDGTEQKGLLLASFSDGYIIVPYYDVNEPHKILKIHTHEVSSIELTTIKWLQQYVRKSQEEVKELESIEAQNGESSGEDNINRQATEISEDEKKR